MLLLQKNNRGERFTQGELFVNVLVNKMHNHYFRRLTKGGFGFAHGKRKRSVSSPLLNFGAPLQYVKNILHFNLLDEGTHTCQHMDPYSVELNIQVYWRCSLFKILGIFSGEMQKLLFSAGQPLAKNQEGVGCIAGVPAGKMKV